MLLYGLDIKLAGSPSFAVSLPTMLVAFARYSRDQASTVLRGNGTFVVAMTAGSITGTLLGGLLLGIVPKSRADPRLAVILLFSTASLWRHPGLCRQVTVMLEQVPTLGVAAAAAFILATFVGGPVRWWRAAATGVHRLEPGCSCKAGP